MILPDEQKKRLAQFLLIEGLRFFGALQQTGGSNIRKCNFIIKNISGSRVKMMRYLETVNYKYFTTHCLKPIPVLEKGKAGESSSMVDQIGGT